MVRNKTAKAPAPKKVAKPKAQAEKAPRGRRKKAEVDQLKPAAKQLYILGKTLKDVSALMGVDEKTIGKWAIAEGWAAMRQVITVSKPNILKSLYDQLNELSADIETRDKGKRYSNAKEGDTFVKLTAAIKNLEGEAGVSETVEVFMRYGEWMAVAHPERLKELTDFQDEYVTYLFNKNVGA